MLNTRPYIDSADLCKLNIHYCFYKKLIKKYLSKTHLLKIIMNRATMNKVAISWKFRLINTAIMAMLLSGLMTLYITFVNLGSIEGFVYYWLKAWMLAAPVAFVCVMIIASPVQKLTKRILEPKQK